MMKTDMIIKRIALLFAIIAMVFSLAAVPAFADELELLEDGETGALPADPDTLSEISGGLNYPDLPRVIDNAGLLTYAESEDLAAKIAGITERHGCDIVILTVYYTDGKEIMDYADDFYDYGGLSASSDKSYGWGSSRDGLILVVNMGEREWWISTCGRAIDVFTDYGIELLGGTLGGYLGSGDYAAGFEAFLDQCEDDLVAYERGDPVDTWFPDPPDDYYNPGSRAKKEFSPVPYLVCLGVGLLIAAIVTSSMKSKLKTSVPRKRADDYILRDTFDLMAKEDVFLYSHTTSTPRNTDSGSRSGGGHYGGSSSHTSSSGSSHGGGGGHF